MWTPAEKGDVRKTAEGSAKRRLGQGHEREKKDQDRHATQKKSLFKLGKGICPF